MELYKKEKEWFLSEEGTNKFCALSSLEERTIFIYSYLKSTVNESFEKNNTLFKIAFFFADAVYNSNKPYSKYPQLLNAEMNPFLKFVEKSKNFYSNEKTYIIFTAILNGKVDAYIDEEWIYNSDFLESEFFLEELLNMGIEYLPTHELDMVDPKTYETTDENNFLQLQMIWMFLK